MVNLAPNGGSGAECRREMRECRARMKARRDAHEAAGRGLGYQTEPAFTEMSKGLSSFAVSRKKGRLDKLSKRGLSFRASAMIVAQHRPAGAPFDAFEPGKDRSRRGRSGGNAASPPWSNGTRISAVGTRAAAARYNMIGFVTGSAVSLPTTTKGGVWTWPTGGAGSGAERREPPKGTRRTVAREKPDVGGEHEARQSYRLCHRRARNGWCGRRSRRCRRRGAAGRTASGRPAPARRAVHDARRSYSRAR